MKLTENLDSKIEQLVGSAFSELHPSKAFVAGETNIPVTGKVFGHEELLAATKASLDFWLTSGPYTEEFDLGITIKQDDVFCVTTPVTDLLNQYNKMFGSGIQIAPASLRL